MKLFTAIALADLSYNIIACLLRNETISGILPNGITWGRHQVVTKNEAEMIGQEPSHKE